MLSITSSQPLAWSSVPAPAVAPVSAAVQVAPVQATARDSQTGSGPSGRDASTAAAQSARPGAPAERVDERTPATTLDAAPLLPRPQAEDGQNPQGKDQTELDQIEAEAEAERQARQAEDVAFRQQLKEVISKVWKASAAVVDAALGTDATDPASGDAVAGATAAAGGTPALPSDAGGAEHRVAPRTANLPATDSAAAVPEDLADLRAHQDVVAYDAQGQSSLAPLEAGSLISQRV